MSTKTKSEPATETEIMDARPTETGTSLARPQHHSSDGLVYDASDVDIPIGNIVQKISQIDGPVGSLVVDKKHVILPAETPRDVYVVKALKEWHEDLPFGTEGGQYAKTEEEYRALVEQGVQMVEHAYISLMIPSAGEEVDEAAFPFPFGDRHYCLARLYVAKDAYRQTYKRLATYVAMNQGRSFRERLWTFESQLITKGKYSWYAPSLSISASQPDPQVVEFIRSF